MIKMECLVMRNHVHAAVLDVKDIIFSQACKAWLDTILACQWANAECYNEGIRTHVRLGITMPTVNLPTWIAAAVWCRKVSRVINGGD